ncbi:amino acid-binding protein [Trinickia caryophylli]|uniref:amino acid-binding protein n=1 Tax=Trinickia caryophylli TaxID=28094 RepID=UPI0018EBCF47|nr:amino acid-binding protein [Trinickia caryophylli]WQE12072.1 amino acid-binding protein [Trinickia caryophylli]
MSIELDHEPGALARMGEVLGAAGLSVEGGGVWAVDGRAVAHFLFEHGEAARRVLEDAGIVVRAVRDVLVQRLDQALPGQLGAIARRMADAGVNLEVMYSDHDHRLVLVVDDHARGRAVSQAWEREREEREREKREERPTAR